ncbi:hypothetical protein RvY_10126 [Ramazzottius varieornatus]|uniref:Enoyl-CoA hydratase n=1 Tax=Ramazzottius varieornatus TaxID=947166 RepID=A0A1D1VDV8_RAMVA|nr:hypothetical protein RvY_10126 [Ramazzottius varieornatus]
MHRQPVCSISRFAAFAYPGLWPSPTLSSISGCALPFSNKRRGFPVHSPRFSSQSSDAVSEAERVSNHSRPTAKKLVETEQRGDVMLIGLNRPEKRNCVNEATAKELLAAVTEFEENKSAKVGVLYGKGGYFCAGWDLSALSGRDAEWVKSLPAFPALMGPTRNFINKPLIAAIQGYAVAGGLELSLMCDMRFMEEDAILGVFCRRYGVPLVDGGTVRLPALIGLSRALDLILTGRPVDAKEALSMGLVNRVVGRGSAIGEALKAAQTIARFPQECMLADRESAYHSTFTAKSLEDALVFEHEKGKQIIINEAIAGAKGFVFGLGKHGKFNFNAQKINDLVHSEKK